MNNGDHVTTFVANVKVNGEYLDATKGSDYEKYFEGKVYAYPVVE